MKETYNHEFNRFQRAIAKVTGMWRINRDSIDFTWGYFCPRWCFSFTVSPMHLSIGMVWGQFSFHRRDFDWFESPRYGFVGVDNSLLLYWGKDTRLWDVPFLSLVWESDAIEVNGSWRKLIKNELQWQVAEKEAEKHTFDYTYTLESGEIQTREVTVYKRQMTWYRKWLPFLKYKRTFLDASFNTEIGERVHTWKGGTIACTFDMLPSETIEQCVRRHESTKKFF